MLLLVSIVKSNAEHCHGGGGPFLLSLYGIWVRVLPLGWHMGGARSPNYRQ